jgi:hypothetical protein
MIWAISGVTAVSQALFELNPVSMFHPATCGDEFSVVLPYKDGGDFWLADITTFLS